MNDLCRILEWDSAFFGYQVARIVPTQLTAAEADSAMSWCRKHDVDCAYFLCEDEPSSIRQAERCGFELMDVRVEMEWRQNKTNPSGIGDAEVLRPFHEEDLPELQRIARTAFTRTRFYADERFSRARADELYAAWIQRSCAGETVFVADHVEQIAGFVSVSVDREQCGHIGLLAVAAESRGKGIGANLVRHAQRSLAFRAVCSCTVITQGRNIAAQRLYQACGFRPVRQQLWYHRWFADRDAKRGPQ